MFDRCLYFNINALARLVNKKWAEAFSVLDLSPAHGYMLRVVLLKPGITPKELGAELQLEKSTISRFIDSMQKKGLVIRNKSASVDGRGQNIYPTGKANEIHASLEDLGESLYQTMVSGIGKRQLAMLVNSLRKNAKKIQ